MMPEAAMWPQGACGGCTISASPERRAALPSSTRIEKSYGGADNVADWVWLAQFVNYEGYRAMFEAQSKNRMGLLIWMSHPTWPSFVWQTYDYYLRADGRVLRRARRHRSRCTSSGTPPPTTSRW